jgi:dolichol-phosphate mannosyltransferase
MKAMPDQHKDSVSIVIPCFNESEGIELLHSRISSVMEQLSQYRPVELILVDDGSTDDTYFQLQHYFGQSAIVTRCDRNRGLSAAIQVGAAQASGSIICTADSDCTYDPEQLIPMLELMQDDVDIVTASPYHPFGTVKNVPAWRLFLSKGLSRLYWLVLPCKLYTYTSMFRAYRREVFETVTIQDPGFLGLVEILVEALFQDYRITEYPATLQRRVYGQSKLRVARVIGDHLKYIVKLLPRRSLFRSAFKPVNYRSLRAQAGASYQTISKV